MNAEQTRWSQRYQAALSKHLKPGPAASLRLTHALGRRAVILGLKTLDVARLHEKALATMVSPSQTPQSRQRRIKRAKRFLAETVVPIEKTHHTEALTESHRLLNHLRHLTRVCLAAQENDRKTVSRQLHDEIAQTLLAINLRLLTVKESAKANTENLKKEIAETQRLVKESANRVNRFVRRLGATLDGGS